MVRHPGQNRCQDTPPFGFIPYRSRPCREIYGHTHLEMKGEIRVHDEASWKPFTADQYVGAYPPRMVWAGDAQHWPMSRLGILTTCLSGRGEISAYLWKWATFFENRGPSVTAYLRLRWIGEAVWYPTALLHDERISWEAIPSKHSEVDSARIFYDDGDIQVSGTFSFMKSTGAPFLFMVEEGGDPDLSIYRFYCTYSKWTRFGNFLAPCEVTEGILGGALREDRLKITVSHIDFE